MRKDFGSKTMMFPMPVLIIAAYNDDGSINAMNAAWGGIETDERIGICISEGHKTTKDIKKRKAFTVSFATKEYVAECDYVGISSGNKDVNKMDKTHFTYTKSKNVDAPIINELKVALECKMISYDDESNHLVGEIVNVSADESVLTDGKIDIFKLNPIIFDTSNHQYITLDKVVAKAFNVGLTIK